MQQKLNVYTKDMWRKISGILAIVCLFSSVNAQEDSKGMKNPFKNKRLDVSVSKSGPYFGLQRGEYLILELGVEQQWKKIKLKTAKTQALSTGFNYNFKYNVLGYDAGYWIKPSRVGLTYGANVIFRTNFDENRVGIAPVVGYKLYGFHLQTGYHFLTPASNFDETNRFFISLRFILINDRDTDYLKKRRGGK